MSSDVRTFYWLGFLGKREAKIWCDREWSALAHHHHLLALKLETANFSRGMTSTGTEPHDSFSLVARVAIKEHPPSGSMANGHLASLYRFCRKVSERSSTIINVEFFYVANE